MEDHGRGGARSSRGCMLLYADYFVDDLTRNEVTLWCRFEVVYENCVDHHETRQLLYLQKKIVLASLVFHRSKNAHML
jgi:hypothetical protein